MRATLADKAIVIWLAAATLLWMCCLAILWGAATDTSGRASLVTIAATLLAVALAAQLPGRLLRLAQRVASRLNLGKALAAASALGGDLTHLDEGRAAMRTLAAAAVFAAACGGLSTGAIYAASPLIDLAARAMLFSPAAWSAFTLAVQVAAMLPMAVGLATLFLASGLVRSGGGRDVYATVFREWLWGLAAALLALAACWRMGANLLALAALTGVALLAGALVLLQRRRAAVSPPHADRPVETPSPLRSAGVAATFAIAAAAMMLQVRLAGDALGLSLPVAAAWAALTVALVAGFLTHVDQKTRPPGQGQRMGATLGVFAGLLMQGALLITALRGGRATAVCCVIAAAGQLPIAALASIVISRQRRLFAEAGGHARFYLCATALGSAVGVLAYLAAMSMPGGPRVALAGSMAAALAATVACVVRARSAREQLAWAAAGAALLCSLAGGMIAAARTVRPSGLRAGVWLTAASDAAAGRGLVPGAKAEAQPWRSEGVGRALSAIMSAHRGQWLVAVTSCVDVPPVIDSGIHVTLSAPEPALLPRGDCGVAVVGREADLFAAGRIGRRRYDGILLALLPAGHGDAWRCYNDQAIRRQLRRLQDGGLAALRIQASGADAAVALAATRTFYDAVGQSWLVAEARGGQLDLLVVGPAARMEPPPAGDGAIVVSCRRLWYEWPDVRAIRLQAPGAARTGKPSAEDIIRRLRSIPRE